MKKLNQLRQGFTLIELLIVVSIIGILSVALIPNLSGAPARARDAARKAMLSEVAAAIESYNIDTGTYPDLNGAGADEVCLIKTGTATDSIDVFIDTYMKGQAPTAQANGNDTDCSTGVNYLKLSDGYVIYVNLETGLGGEYDFNSGTSDLKSLTEANDSGDAIATKDGTDAHAVIR